LRRTFNKIVIKRPRGKKSESDRKEARRILGLFLRYERPRLKRLGDDSHDNAPCRNVVTHARHEGHLVLRNQAFSKAFMLTSASGPKPREILIAIFF
jgi:hypothetical protein